MTPKPLEMSADLLRWLGWVEIAPAPAGASARLVARESVRASAVAMQEDAPTHLFAVADDLSILHQRRMINPLRSA